MLFKRYVDRRAAAIKERNWAQVATDLQPDEKPVEFIRIDASESGVARWGLMFVTDQRVIWTLEFPDRSQQVFNFVQLDQVEEIIRHESRAIAIITTTEEGEKDARIAYVSRIVPAPMIDLFLTAFHDAHASARQRAAGHTT